MSWNSNLLRLPPVMSALGPRSLSVVIPVFNSDAILPMNSFCFSVASGLIILA